MLTLGVPVLVVVAAIIAAVSVDRYLMVVAHTQGGWLVALLVAPGSVIPIFGIVENPLGIVLSAAINGAYYFGWVWSLRRWRQQSAGKHKDTQVG